ncbi:MAG: BtrH N-terminal domain-containing protein [Bacteroidales bacterium]|jgi:hypothetical protein|nr:BtrH N-terminal domain-containing protein [Bacteroidales bacterium]
MNLNFEHRSTAHCETGVISNLMNFYGIKLSEPMAFGIGAGLFFVCMPFVPFKGNMMKFSFRTLPGAVFKHSMKNLKIKVGRKNRFFNKEKAMKKVDDLLAQGIPVGNVVGLYFLPHTPLRIHFNAHHLCVIGKEGDIYTVSDPTVASIQNLSSDVLKKVRFSRGMLRPQGKMYWIKEKPNESLDLKSAIIKGIKTTCYNMLDIPILPIGVNGITSLSKQIRNIEKKYGEQDALFFLATLLQAMEEFGTGGAGFRFLYSAFLYEAAEVLQKMKLKVLAEEMSIIGDLWRAFALECGRKFKNRSNESCNELADRLLVIAEKEKRFFVSLRKFINTECKK